MCLMSVYVRVGVWGVIAGCIFLVQVQEWLIQ